MNEVKATADIVGLMSKVVIIVDVDKGQKKKRPAATDRKEKRNKQRKYQEKYDRIQIFCMTIIT